MIKREHDQFYLNEDNKKTKQMFVEVANEVARESFKTIADIGCATGAFPNFLKTRFPKIEIVGIDYKDNLISKAKRDFPELEFCYGNVLDKNSIKKKFDVITLIGVLSIFDDYKKALDNLISWLNPSGRLIISGMVSEFEIDVFTKYKPSSLEYNEKDLESGWNIISNKSLELAALSNNSKIISSKPFKLNLELQKQKDVLRSWTEERLDGNKDIFNALHIRQPHRIVTIKKN